MTEVFFYHGASDRVAAACALLGGAYAQKKPMWVLVPDPAVAELLDRQLWTANALSFIPHCRADSALAADTPIVLAERLPPELTGERLMNLGAEVPASYPRFAKLIEVVGQDEDERLAGRERVRRYRADGCAVNFVDLSHR